MKGMMKVLAGLIVLGSLGYVGWVKLFGAESRACKRVAQLCDSVKDERECVDNIEKLRKAAGDAAVAQMESCVGQAKSCVEVAGCAVGSTVGGIFGEFMRGVQKGMGK